VLGEPGCRPCAAGKHGVCYRTVTTDIRGTWGRFNVPDPLPVIDSLLATTAHVHKMTVATRNVSDIARTGVPVLDPFDTGNPTFSPERI